MSASSLKLSYDQLSSTLNMVADSLKYCFDLNRTSSQPINVKLNLIGDLELCPMQPIRTRILNLLHQINEQMEELFPPAATLIDHPAPASMSSISDLSSAPLSLSPSSSTHHQCQSHQLTFNLALFYSSRGEITKSLSKMLELNVSPEDYTVELLQSVLRPSTPPDILLRSSGLSRLSDSLLWEVTSHPCLLLFKELKSLSACNVASILGQYQRFKHAQLHGTHSRRRGHGGPAHSRGTPGGPSAGHKRRRSRERGRGRGHPAVSGSDGRRGTRAMDVVLPSDSVSVHHVPYSELSDSDSINPSRAAFLADSAGSSCSDESGELIH
eukprot:gnl/Dysnectes_brevis/5179_a7341_411.p1 GENE.gnl/Dysnectes_brevis/5179_a7341_411~~gnl/Dysnectes_brevis/5179_a7341_411.p1  ORF type:complete len:373 (+),score=33.15 gnl/Dysnectes_brevis/5179_a7341_411:142-1119(+)